MKIKVEITRQENADHFGKAVGGIAEVDFEEYVAAVVASEIGNARLEACKAQAVAARTYAVRRGVLNGKAISDSSENAQAYRAGRCDREKYPNAVEAAKATAGEVLVYGGSVIEAVYSAGNGGWAVSSQEHWGSDKPYLPSHPDPWDAMDGRQQSGHGVGMSQRGAMKAAENGYDYTDILAFYYPGTELVGNYNRAEETEGSAEWKNKLTIYQRYFYQSDCYKSGTKMKPAGVQVHSTGANNPWLKRYVQPDDGRLGTNPNGNDHNHPGGNVCANAYIGKLQDGTVAVYQTLPWDMRCWLSGSGANGNANRLGYIGFEVCEDGLRDKAYYEDAVMDKAVLLTAALCKEYGIPVEDVRDHRELHGMGLASNHADITHWLGKFGLTMNDFREKVRRAMEEGIEVTYVDCDTEQGLYDAVAVNPGTYLNLRKEPGQNYASIGRIPRGETVRVLDDANAEWWLVSYQGTSGYAMAKFLERVPEDPETPEEQGEEGPGASGDDTPPYTEEEPQEALYACIADLTERVERIEKALGLAETDKEEKGDAVG